MDLSTLITLGGWVVAIGLGVSRFIASRQSKVLRWDVRNLIATVEAQQASIVKISSWATEEHGEEAEELVKASQGVTDTVVRGLTGRDKLLLVEWAHRVT